MNSIYVVKWQSTNGPVRQWTEKMTREKAEQEALAANKRWPKLHHWIECVAGLVS